MKVYNELNDAFIYLIENYSLAKTEQLTNHPMGIHVRQCLTKILIEDSKLDQNEYCVKGSVGQGVWSEIPWISIFSKNITTTATKGYYVVYLVPADMSGVYVSLNQGWTYFKDKYGVKQGKTKIEKTADLMREKLHMIPSNLTLSSIDLKGIGPLSKGYEKGHIAGCFYTIENFPSSKEIIQDLQNLLVVYKEIDTLIGVRTIDQFNDHILMNDDDKFIENESESESLYQETIRKHIVLDEEDYSNDIAESVPRPEAIVQKGGKLSWPRNASIAAKAILRANYQCEYDSSLPVFTSKYTGQSFMEAHHLVPMSLQEEFDISLDQVDNIICLSPHAHRLIHHAVDNEREEVLRKLFEESNEKLKSIGIDICFDDLKKAYSIEIHRV